MCLGFLIAFLYETWLRRLFEQLGEDLVVGEAEDGGGGLDGGCDVGEHSVGVVGGWGGGK